MNIPFPAAKSFSRDSSRGVTVLLGPTNTGKTHYAIERMLAPFGIVEVVRTGKIAMARGAHTAMAQTR